MAITVGGSNSGIKAELNVVPLIDILLVLLVIFMVMPHRQVGLDAQVPQPASKTTRRSPADVIVVQVLANGTLRVNRQEVAWGSLQQSLEDIFKLRADRTAFVRGDKEVEFQSVAQVISMMRGAGVARVGLLTPGLEKQH
jgi:biopolymer transport protein ExbD